MRYTPWPGDKPLSPVYSRILALVNRLVKCRMTCFSGLRSRNARPFVATRGTSYWPFSFSKFSLLTGVRVKQLPSSPKQREWSHAEVADLVLDPVLAQVVGPVLEAVAAAGEQLLALIQLRSPELRARRLIRLHSHSSCSRTAHIGAFRVSGQLTGHFLFSVSYCRRNKGRNHGELESPSSVVPRSRSRGFRTTRDARIRAAVRRWLPGYGRARPSY